VAQECSSGFCRAWFVDIDGDFHGSGSRTLLCSPDPADDTTIFQASGAVIAFLSVDGTRYSEVGDDCCDSTLAIAANIFPGNTNPGITPQTACPSVASFDYNCSGTVTDQFSTFGIGVPSGGCSSLVSSCSAMAWVGALPDCGTVGQVQSCTSNGSTCVGGPPQDLLRSCM
jgi:hypothetical protein